MAQGKKEKKDGTLRIKGEDGQTVEIPAGRWYQNPKARPERLMLNAALSADARRVLDCLEYHSIAFGKEAQEVCIIQEAGKKRRDLTPTDVSAETKLPKQRVRRALVELEHAGAARRRAVDGGSLRNGKVRLVCFAEPRELPPYNAGEGNNRARQLWPDWFPQDCAPLKAYITREKINLLDNIDAVFEGDARDSFVSELKEAAREYFEAAEVIARKLERVRARSNGRPLQLGRKTKPERQQQQTDKTPPSAAADPPPEPPPDPDPLHSQDPPAPGNAAPAAEEARHAPPQAPADVELPADVENVLAAMAPHCAEPDAARALIAGCRLTAPGCTIPEICAFTARKAEEIPRRKIRNPAGWLIKTVPRMLEGNYKSRLTRGPEIPISSDLQDFSEGVSRVANMLRSSRRTKEGRP